MAPIAHGLDVLQGEGGGETEKPKRKQIMSGNLLPAIVVIRRSLNEIKSKGTVYTVWLDTV